MAKKEWKALLDKANEDLKQYGARLNVSREDNTYTLDVVWTGKLNYAEDYACGYYEEEMAELINEAWAHVRAKAKGDFAHEVSRDIDECLAHVLARVKNPELVQAQENTMDAMRRLWEGLSGEQQVDLMTEFYYQLMDAEKDRFLRETDNG